MKIKNLTTISLLFFSLNCFTAYAHTTFPPATCSDGSIMLNNDNKPHTMKFTVTYGVIDLPTDHCDNTTCTLSYQNDNFKLFYWDPSGISGPNGLITIDNSLLLSYTDKGSPSDCPLISGDITEHPLELNCESIPDTVTKGFPFDPLGSICFNQ